MGGGLVAKGLPEGEGVDDLVPDDGVDYEALLVLVRDLSGRDVGPEGAAVYPLDGVDEGSFGVEAGLGADVPDLAETQLEPVFPFVDAIEGGYEGDEA